MKKLQCAICGGNLVMDTSGEFAICDSCGIQFKKDTIKKMVVELSGPVKIDGVVQVDGLQSLEQRLENAKAYEKINELEKAEDVYTELEKDYASDYRTWLEHARFATRNHINRTVQINKLYENAISLAPQELITGLTDEFDECSSIGAHAEKLLRDAFSCGDMQTIKWQLEEEIQDPYLKFVYVIFPRQCICRADSPYDLYVRYCKAEGITVEMSPEKCIEDCNYIKKCMLETEPLPAIYEYIVEKFKQTDQIDLNADKMAKQRIVEALFMEYQTLKTGSVVKIYLPFISANADGPKHLQISVSINSTIQTQQTQNQAKKKGLFMNLFK